MRLKGLLASLIVLTLLLLISPVPVVHAGIQVITTTADNNAVDGLCSLREAITRVNAGSSSADCPNIGASPNTIRLAAGATYTLASQLPIITTTDLTIEPVSGTATVEANAAPNTATYRVFGFNSTGTFTLNNLTIRNGDTTTPATSGGCINLQTNGTLILNNITFTNCTAGGSGGGAIAALNGGSIQISGGAFTGNESANGTSGGGAIYMNGNSNAASLTISGGTNFTSNIVTTTGSGRSGGAISCVLCSASITGGTFSGNSTTTTGGATGGGALYLNTDLTVTISGVTFTSNSTAGTSTSEGGAIHVSFQRAINLTISGSVFSGNSTSGGTASGGALYVANGTVSISNSRFETNTAGSNGDAIYYSSPSDSSIITSCITDNGDTAVFDSGANGMLDASGGGNVANANWWGTSWGPRISGAGAGTGSEVSNGDSINGNGNTMLGGILVDVNLSDPSNYSGVPTGDWLTTAPIAAGEQCMVCTEVSSVGHGRTCS